MTKLTNPPIPGPVFGATSTFVRQASLTYSGAIGAQAVGAAYFTVNGIAGLKDRVFAEYSADLTSGIVPVGADATAPNQVRLKLANVTTGSITPGAMTVRFLVGENSYFRQAFALSRITNYGMVLCGVDTHAAEEAVIFRSQDGGLSWKPMFGVGAGAVRAFVDIGDEPLNSPDTGEVVTTRLALTGDLARVYRSTDSGETWTQVIAPVSGTASVAFCGEVAGGEGTATDVDDVTVLVGLSDNVYGARVFKSTDGGSTFNTPTSGLDADRAVIWSLVWLPKTGGGDRWLAFLHNLDTQTDVVPAVYSSDDGETWAKEGEVGATGQVWQAAFRTAAGTVLAGQSGTGTVYRSTDKGATWTAVFSASGTVGSEVKVRAFHQWLDGTLWMLTQNGGYLWRSTDDGQTWALEHRIGFGSSVFNVRGFYSDMLLVGGGRGFGLNGLTVNPTVYRLVRIVGS
jgi:hypothetical protein